MGTQPVSIPYSESMNHPEAAAVIRPETPSDAAAVHRVLLEAFGGPVEAALVDALRCSPAFVPELSLVAKQGGLVVAHLLFTRAGLAGGPPDVPLLALGPVGVLPEHQRRGIGSRLIREGLAAAAALGYAAVVLVGHPDYYPRFGFRPARSLGLQLPFDVPDEVAMALVLDPGAASSLRGAVIYPPEFSGV